MKLNVIFKSDKLLVILSAILYSIPYINFDLYILHWFFLLPILYLIEFKKTKVQYIGRNASSTTATGNYNKHLAEQKKILEKVFGKLN